MLIRKNPEEEYDEADVEEQVVNEEGNDLISEVLQQIILILQIALAISIVVLVIIGFQSGNPNKRNYLASLALVVILFLLFTLRYWEKRRIYAIAFLTGAIGMGLIMLLFSLI
mgnify:CR=1 FL=1